MVRTILLVVVPCLSIMTESPVKCIKLTVWRVSPSCRCLQHVLCTLGDAAPATCHFYFGKKKNARGPATTKNACMAWHGMEWVWRNLDLTGREGRRGLTLAGRSQAWCSVVCTSSYNCHYCVYYCIYICIITCVHACVCLPIARSMRTTWRADRGTVDGWMDGSR